MNDQREWQNQVEAFQSQLHTLHAFYQRCLLMHCAMQLQQQVQVREGTVHTTYQFVKQFRRSSSQRLYRLAQLLDPDKSEAVQQAAGEAIAVEYHVLADSLERQDGHDTQN